MAAGFDPSGFWGLTLRQFDLHMRGAILRVEREAEIRNRQAYNTAALSGAAWAGKLPPFDRAFAKRVAAAPAAHQRQSPEVLEANLRAMARAWGAV